ncbi:cob(I)yrinic acid a,c-diamide adenosyltransferase [Nocardiopsis lambiniae]|uniref:Cob(I)yrinic acid a,c-diamide adenosyltransferase n=1 Tax=Nocardiopsis lambiniae TaxID=3075539 RepID=A0ABU2M4P6_9ACTN|nr:cob(I)yrinic acid a,c-diamide adenosyltransferase [Nocardiopsis sp. DSM 44743]MDT0327553.1 cob(I)yrinic acid a,c-diamide adenosyltransferase [Nocardiopsis sp. DSM 44743]
MLFSGEGWGKSSAALGYAVRSAGHGWPTTFVQFVKGGAWNAAEAAVSATAGIRWPVFAPGLTWGAEDPRALCDRAWAAAVESLRSDPPGLVVLDEITHAVEHGWLEAARVAEEIRGRHPLTSVILTGRDAPEPLCAVADTITGFTLVKHESKKGILDP